MGAVRYGYIGRVRLHLPPEDPPRTEQEEVVVQSVASPKISLRASVADLAVGEEVREEMLRLVPGEDQARVGQNDGKRLH